jgi:hypothetical protein
MLRLAITTIFSRWFADQFFEVGGEVGLVVVAQLLG